MAVDFKLIGEEESAELAGVSLSTIQQYRQFGLLEAIVQSEDVFYKEIDIKTLFYTAKDGCSGPRVCSDTITDYLPLKDESDEQQSDSEPKARVIPLPTLNELVEDFPAPKEDPTPTEPEPSYTEEPKNSASEEKEVADKDNTSASESIEPEVEVQAVEEVVAQTETKASETACEATPPPGTYELMEMNRSMREQLQMLQEERDWLRQRIEKLESRSEREQMLLLAGSETVRNLVNSDKQRKSLWNFALPWFGWSSKSDHR